MRLRLLSAVAIVLSLAPASLSAAPSLSVLQFLIGDWQAIDTGGGATGGFSFAFGVQNHVITRSNYSNSPATSTQPASRHDDVMLVYVEGDAIKADYVDSEGHAIHYVAEVGANRVSFVSQQKPNEPVYRLSYVKNDDGSLSGKFEMAPPGQSTFAPYLEWRAKKKL